MELILGLAVIIILLLILGVGLDVIIFGFAGLLCLASLFSELLFIYFAVRLLFSKRMTAVFTRIGRTKKGKYDTAFYMTDEGELPNVFPAEVVMKDRLYDVHKTLKLRIDAGKKFVYDRNARLTILLGVPLCTLLCLALLGLARLMLVHYP